MWWPLTPVERFFLAHPHPGTADSTFDIAEETDGLTVGIECHHSETERHIFAYCQSTLSNATVNSYVSNFKLVVANRVFWMGLRVSELPFKAIRYLSGELFVKRSDNSLKSLANLRFRSGSFYESLSDRGTAKTLLELRVVRCLDE